MTERPKMNQRFSELKKQAHEYAVDQEWYIDSFEQRFAELIVRECDEVANDHNSEAEGITLGVGRVIKEHFGVEL